jgi:hypothetical protein
MRGVRGRACDGWAGRPEAGWRLPGLRHASRAALSVAASPRTPTEIDVNPTFSKTLESAMVIISSLSSGFGAGGYIRFTPDSAVRKLNADLLALVSPNTAHLCSSMHIYIRHVCLSVHAQGM